MNDEEKEDIKDIVDDINRDIKRPPYDNNSGEGYSREYQDYKEAEQTEEENTSYEKLCLKMGGWLNLKAGERSRKKLNPPIKLLGWDITPGMVLSAAVGVGFSVFMLWFMLFMANIFLGFLPIPLMFFMLAIPVVAGGYTYYKPVYAAKNKVIQSSGEMILAVLYMVVYMRSSPNLEGAVRFAALNLEGPISDDLKGVLWDIEVGNYKRIEESLENYTKAWKDYNQDFLESLQLLKASTNEPDSDRRESMLQDSIDTILDGTREKMKHYAQSLKMPVMILNAMGAMLPVLGMIMLPLVSIFMGDVIRPLHLILLYNILLPIFLYWFMQRILSSRPPTVTFNPTSEEVMPERGNYTFNVLGKDMKLPVWPLGLLVFVLVGAYGILGYISFPAFYPTSIDPASAPQIFVSGEELNSMAMLLRSISITLGLGLAIGITKILGNVERKEFEEKIQSIEEEFPNALFQLGNKISGGTPVELALSDAAEATSDLEISGLFGKASTNVREMGMDFEDALFDPNYGAIRQYPSQMIDTVMKAVLESSKKGTKTASMAMMTISRYLDSIHKTKENLNDLMEETTTTIQMLAYLLAPVISGVAVGMSQTIISAMFNLSQNFDDTIGDLPSQQGAAGGTEAGFGGILGNLEAAISPEMLQFVVGIYLIQLLWILGTFYVKITHGEDKTRRDLFVGKVLISGMFFYSITLLIVGTLFGGMVSGIT